MPEFDHSGRDGGLGSKQLPQDTVLRHYAGMNTDGREYDTLWNFGRAYDERMTDALVLALELNDRQEACLVSLGGGTGYWEGLIAEKVGLATKPFVIDPSVEMLRNASDSVQTVVGRAEDFATRNILPDIDNFDILMRDCIHHVTNKAATLSGIVDRMTPGRTFAMVMTAPDFRYPLFPAATRHLDQLQPDTDNIRQLMIDAGLTGVEERVLESNVRIPFDQYSEMLRGRYLSVLELFSDDQIERGIREIEAELRSIQGHDANNLVVEFDERLVFVTGRAA